MDNKDKNKGKRPVMLSDKLGYPENVGDKDWEEKHKHLYTKKPDGSWVRNGN